MASKTTNSRLVPSKNRVEGAQRMFKQFYWFFILLTAELAVSSAQAQNSSSDPSPQNEPSQVWEALGPSFSLRSSYWSDDTRFTSDYNYWVGSAWLTLRPKEIGGIRFYLDSYLEAENLTRNLSRTLELREFYADRSWGDFDLRIGRQIIVWGRADKLNPTDSLSIRDYRRLFTDDEDQRKGIFAIQVTYNWGSYRLKGIWEPEWRSPGLPLPNLGSSVTWLDRAPQHPHYQFGLKVDQSGSGSLDWSMSYFHGYGRAPDLVALPRPTGVTLELNYPEIHVFGADFAATIGEWGLRGETAYTCTPPSSRGNPLQQKSSLFTVIGVEKGLTEGFSVNLQYLNRWIQDYTDPTLIPNPVSALIATQSTLNSQQMVRLNQGISLRPDYKLLNETLELELAWVWWLTTHEQLLRPKLTYALTDGIKLIIGSQNYFGASNTFFGRLRPTQAGFAEFRWNI